MSEEEKDKIFKLRQISGKGCISCKEALIQSNWNIEDALKYLRLRGLPSGVCRK